MTRRVGYLSGQSRAADLPVLTKVGVYTGIGLVVTTIAPEAFQWIESRIFR